MKQFEVKEAHIKLLRHGVVGWCGDEWGGPCFDGRYPYGDGDLYGSIAEILGVKAEFEQERDGEGAARYWRSFDRLHKETATALAIILRIGQFKPGRYEASDYGDDWREVS